MTVARVAAYTAPSVDWQILLQGLSLGTGTPYGLRSLEGFGLPPTRTADAERAGADGAFGGRDQAGVRSLVFGLQVAPRPGFGDPAVPILMRDLNKAFARVSDDVPLTFQVPGWGQLLVLGRPRRAAYLYDPVAVPTGRPGIEDKVLVEFAALDPLIYAVAVQDAVISYPTAGTQAGLPFNAAAFGGMTFQPRRIIQNGGFEVASLAPWITTVSALLAAGATLTQDLVTFHGGAAAGKLVTSGASVNQGVRQQTLTNLLPLTSYTFTVWVNLTTAGGAIQLAVQDVTNGITALSPTTVSGLGAWTQLTATLVTGAVGPALVELAVRDTGTAVARTFYVDDVRGDLTSAIQAYSAPAGKVGAVLGAIGGGAGASGFSVLTNNGSASTAPVSTLYGPSTGPLVLEKIESGEVITLNINLGAADSLELDHDLHSVFLNGNTNRQDVVDTSTSWWVLPPGPSTVHYRTFGASPGSYADVKWRDAWW